MQYVIAALSSSATCFQDFNVEITEEKKAVITLTAEILSRSKQAPAVSPSPRPDRSITASPATIYGFLRS